MWVRGGTYSSQTGFKITVSGTPTNKVTFKQYTGETVILDGSIAEFTPIGNTAWEPYGTLSSSHNVYRSVNTFPVTGLIYYGGFIQIDGEWYSLAPHTSDADIVSDNHVWVDPHTSYYLGPGISQNKTVGSLDYGHLFIRLDNSTTQAQLGRSVTQISDPDPRNHELFLCSSSYFGLTITGSHLVIEDFAQINHFNGCFYMGTAGQTDVTIRNCGGRPVYFGARCGNIDGLTLDSCNFYAHMPSHKWWVAAGDIKGGPAGHVRKLGLDLGLATHVEVVYCLFEEFFDGILATGTPANAPHDVEIHSTTFYHIWDDAWQMYGNLYHINFHHNFCYGAGPSVDDTLTAQANTDPGTVYIHHNVIDTTTRLVFWGRYGSPGAGVRESIPLSSHGSPTVYTWPRKFYYNTIVTGQTVGGPVVGWGLFGATATNSQATHEVYNNIFDVIDGRPGGRDFDATTGREIYDGNVYWHYQVDSPSHFRSPWQLLHMSPDITIHDTFTTVVELRASQAFLDSQTYYPPGWESSGLSVDPQLDSTYKPQTASCQTGAVNLTTKGWPGTASYEAWRGAMNPS